MSVEVEPVDATLPEAPGPETAAPEAAAPVVERAGVGPERKASARKDAEPDAGQPPVPPALPAAPSDLGPPPGAILSSDDLAVAGRKAMWLHVDRLLRHEAAMRDPAKADELRKFRVATRRLRAAMRLFRSAFRASELQPLADGLGEVADAVGLVRDLDVRITALVEWAAEPR